MAQSITVTGGTAAAITSSGTIVLNPVARSTTVMLSATVTSTTAGAARVDFSLDDPTIPGGPTATWVQLSSAAINSSLIAATPLAWTVLSPIGMVRVVSTTGSTGSAPDSFVLKALQSITA